jgi:hypothetical protein
VRHLACREGWRYQHVQAIIVAIDQYAEAALGNREFFLNKPYGIGDLNDHIPWRRFGSSWLCQTVLAVGNA